MLKKVGNAHLVDTPKKLAEEYKMKYVVQITASILLKTFLYMLIDVPCLAILHFEKLCSKCSEILLAFCFQVKREKDFRAFATQFSKMQYSQTWNVYKHDRNVFKNMLAAIWTTSHFPSVYNN